MMSAAEAKRDVYQEKEESKIHRGSCAVRLFMTFFSLSVIFLIFPLVTSIKTNVLCELALLGDAREFDHPMRIQDLNNARHDFITTCFTRIEELDPNGVSR